MTTAPRAPRRPATVRPRSDATYEGVAPPTRTELEAIERQQIEWAALMGAEHVEERDLGAVLVRHRDPGPGFNLATRIRWHADDVSERLAALDHRMRTEDRWPSIFVSEGVSEPPDLEERMRTSGW